MKTSNIPEDTIEVNHHLWRKTNSDLHFVKAILFALVIILPVTLGMSHTQISELLKQNRTQRDLLEGMSHESPWSPDPDKVRECQSLYKEIYWQDTSYGRRALVADLYKELYQFPAKLREKAWLEVQPDLRKTDARIAKENNAQNH